jgi:hypothetical protein
MVMPAKIISKRWAELGVVNVVRGMLLSMMTRVERIVKANSDVWYPGFTGMIENYY